MPRLDNSDTVVIYEFELSFDPQDPGATDPVDLCNPCAASWPDELQCTHPPYEEQFPPYTCRDCGEILEERDNGYM